MNEPLSLPNGWVETTFGAVVTPVSVNDKKLPRGEYLESGRYPVVDQGRQFIGGYSDDETRVVSEDLPLLIFGDHTRAFKYLDQPFVPGADGVKVLKPLGVNAKWLYQIAHVLDFPDKGYARHYQHLRSARLLVPPLPEQRRIVAEIEKQFTRLDKGVTALRRVQANLKRYRAAVLKAACEGRLVPTEAELSKTGRMKVDFDTGETLLSSILTERRKGWQSRGQYKEPATPDTTVLSQLPDGWMWARLEQLGTTTGGLTKNPKRAKLTKKMPYLRVANVYANELRLQEIEHIGVEDSELEKLLVCAGDLLIVEGNGSKDQIGRLAVWDGSIDPCVHQNHLIKVRPTEPRMSKWILHWLQSPNGRNFVEMVASSTSGLYTLSVNKVGDLPIALPPLAEQSRIVAEVERCLSVVEELEAMVSASLQRAARLRQSILQQAFTAKLTRTDKP
ncbi:MAG: hypothetical protein IPP58_12215 [Holophagaceae bacterium]|uniref:Uncharacterized protein n=1 Tax=Candidatus Geothrix skivensis TaxID=2954439 RepID=A0A9D7XHC9_9BACT|nr:hypothetical protein [Candidatus Geothrix skivensis]